MGKKRVHEASKGPSLPKKSLKASSSQAPSRTKGTKDVYPLMLPPSIRGLTFVNDEQRSKYEILSARKTSEQKFWQIESLRQLGMLDDIVALFRNLGWLEYVEMKYVAYNWLVVEFLSLLNVDWVSLYRCQEVLITFRMFNADHKLSLREFNNLLHLLVHSDSFRDVLSQWHPDPVWLSITCSKRKSYEKHVWAAPPMRPYAG